MHDCHDPQCYRDEPVMGACEWCWGEAQRISMFSGGSVTDAYYQVMSQQQDLGVNARCPLVRATAEKGQQ